MKLALVAVLAAASLSAPAQSQERPWYSIAAVHHDISAPLRTITPLTGGVTSSVATRLIPHQPGTALAPDPVLQTSSSGLGPTIEANFDGVGQGFVGPQGTYQVVTGPPDPNSAVGDTQVFSAVNVAFAVISKTGTVQYGPANNNTMWSGFGGTCQTENGGDPVIRYDAMANRWFFLQLSNIRATSGPYWMCLAVSRTSDATGQWARYAYSYNSLPDYPKAGVWPDAYYVTANLFGTSTFDGAQVCAFDRAKMLAGQAATQQCFNAGQNYASLLASDSDGSNPPPAGAPNPLLALPLGGTNSLQYWKLAVDWTTPSNSRLTGPSTIGVASFTTLCASNPSECVPQQSSSQKLDALSDRLMYRVAYRNIAGRESLVLNHSVTGGMRWYELRMSGGNPTLYQQGTFGPDSTYRWMGASAMDQAGNIALGYSASSSSMYQALRVTGRLASDPLGQMTQGETTIVASGGAQNFGSRFGDYSSLSVDPVDGCTFWYTHQYTPNTSAYANWRTRMASFKLPNCSAPVGDDFSIAANPNSGTLNPGQTLASTVNTQVTNGSAQQVQLSAANAPTGVTVSFNPATVTAGGSSTMTIATTTGVIPGSYSIDVTGTGTVVTRRTAYSLMVNDPNGGGVVNGGFENDLTGWTKAGTATVVTTPVHGGTKAVKVGAVSSDSSVAQTFTATAGMNQLSFWYRMTCPDTITYDWTIATLRDNAAGTTATILPKVCSTDSTYKQVKTAITAGKSYTLTLTVHTDNNTSDVSTSVFDDVALSADTPPIGGVVNGGFESGLDSWTKTGTATAVTSPTQAGAGAGKIGAVNSTSSLAQTFTAPTGANQLSFWYRMTCPDTVTYDWATATLRDNTSGTTSTILPRTCSTDTAFKQVTASVIAGRSYTLTLTNKADNNASDLSTTVFDSVVLSIAQTTPTGIVNGGFESGDLAGWWTRFAVTISDDARTGDHAVKIGEIDNRATLSQQFTAPAGDPNQLVFYYKMSCQDVVANDWFIATLRDNTTDTATVLVPETCKSSNNFVRVAGDLIAGHNYSLIMLTRTDNNAATVSATVVDDFSIVRRR